MGADWDEVDGDWDILSNELRSNGGAAYPASLRHTTELDSDDQYAQLDFVTADVSATLIGPAVRFAAAAETFYGGIIREMGSLRAIVKVVSGTQTVLDSDAAGSGPPQLIRVQFDGSNYEMFDDGVSSFSGTDTSITGNLQVGVIGHSVANGNADNFEAADLAAGSGLKIRHNSLSLGVGR